MSEILKDLLYTKEHEWVRKTPTPKVVVIGITDFAQASLGDITYIEIPEVGAELKKDQVFGSIESVKSVSELFAPLSGKILNRNEALLNDPAPVNTTPYTEGWLLEIEISQEAEFDQLLKPEAYEQIAQ